MRKPNEIVTQKCLDSHVLPIAGTNSERWYIPNGVAKSAMLEYQVTLPRGLTCSQCVLQWTWTSGTLCKWNTYLLNLWPILKSTIYKFKLCVSYVYILHQTTLGNTWGTCKNGTEAMGCGDQEMFRNCADVQIYSSTVGRPPSSIDIPSAIYLRDRSAPTGRRPLIVK